MELEELLNKIKGASRHARRNPTAERLCAAGTLSQMMHYHRAKGKRDLRGKPVAKSLVKDGVPVLANKQRSAAQPKRQSTPRPHLGWANKKFAEWFSLNPDASVDARIAAKSDICKLWKALSPEEQAAIHSAPIGDMDDMDHCEPVVSKGESEWLDHISDGDMLCREALC